MKTIARVLLATLLVFSSVQSSYARYRFLTPAEMIQESQVIAVVDVVSVENRETTSEGWTYTQKASATIEQLIKGTPDKSIVLIGKLKDRRCVPDWTLQPGKQLIFVRKGPSGNYGSVNSGVGLLPIQDGKVAWFPKMDTLDRRVDMPVSKVVASIKTLVKSNISGK